VTTADQNADSAGAVPSKGPGAEPQRHRRTPHAPPSGDADIQNPEAAVDARMRQLQKSQEDLAAVLVRYRWVYDTARTGFVSLDREGVIREINVTAAAWLGRERERLIGLSLADCVASDSRETVRDHVARCGQSRGMVVTEALLDRHHRRPMPVIIESLCHNGGGLYLTTLTDLSERRQAADRLHESESRFRQLAESIGEVFWLITPDLSDVLYISPAFEKIWGMPCEALYEKPLLWLEAVAPEDREALLASLRSWDPEHPAPEVITPDYRIRRPDGSERWISMRAFPILDHKGRLWRLAGTSADITDRKRAEDSLRALSDRSEAILETVPDIIAQVDRNKVYTWMNQAGRGFFGEDAIGKEAAFYFEGNQETYVRVQPVFNGSSDVFYAESWQRRHDGEKRLLAWWCRGIKDANGNMAGALSTGRDITERRKADDALRESEQRYRHLFGNMLEGFAYCRLVYDDQGRPVDWGYLAVNKAFGSLTGLSNVVGRRVSEAIPGIIETNPELLEIYGRVAATGRPKRFESYVVPLSRWLSVSAFSPAPEHFVAVFEDVTKRRESEGRLADYQRQLRSLGARLASAEENARRHIAADLHDNVVQSLAAARLRLQTIGADNLPPGAAASFDEAIRLLHQAVQDTRSLVFELCPPPLYELGLEAALEWLVEKFQHERGLAIVLQTDVVPVPLDGKVRGILFRAVRELLQNVVKHAQAGKATVSVQGQGERVRVEVRDDGQGFDPQAAPAGGRKAGGFGLFEVRERLDYIGGSLEILSPPGGGTTVVLVAPLSAAAKTD
jgi:PAS domain S-box-containing protein